jgi:biopolymer transport protein ExbB/TolQ
MNLRSFLLVVAFALLALFALLNWSAFLSPTELSLGFARVQAPLGLVMLVIVGLVSALFMLYIMVQLAGALGESRRFAKELQSQRELADKAEASRFTDLKGYIAQALGQADTHRAEQATLAAERIAALERRLIEKLDESTRVLSSYIGEVEDKLDRALPSRT